MASKAARPTVIFRDPRIFELVGAGFQKSGGSLVSTSFTENYDDSNTVSNNSITVFVGLESLNLIERKTIPIQWILNDFKRSH